MESEKSGGRISPAADIESEAINSKHERLSSIWTLLGSLRGVEQIGSDPVPVEQKTESRYVHLVTLWFSMNFNLVG